MQIQSIGILGGTGGLGARFAVFFADNFPEIKVQVSGRTTTLTNQDLVQQSDLVIFAVPIEQTAAVIAAMVPYSRPDQIWADFTSIKQQPVAAMLESKAHVCGLHPLFGPLPDITGQTLIYCAERIEELALNSMLALLKDFNLMAFSPAEHDDLMGVVQCASHMSDMVMGETLRQSGFDFETIWQVSSPSYRLKLEVMGRMFAQNPDLYADIATQNLSASRFTNVFNNATQTLNGLVEKGERELLIKNIVQNKEYLSPQFCEQAYLNSQHFLSSFNAQEGTSSQDLGPVNVAVFGEPGSHTDSASAEFEATTGGGDRRFYGSIHNLITAVNTGEAQWGVLPYENTTEGAVLEVLDELLDHPEIQIITAVERSIEQYLMAPNGLDLAAITHVFSHPQAIAQSKPFLRAQLPQASLEAAASTANAARKVKENARKPWAAIGSKTLAEKTGLTLISGNMASDSNRTRFVLIAKNQIPENTSVTCLGFWFNADQAGNLATVLNYFSSANINLLKLDSRRAGADKGEYVFFLDAQISMADFKPHLESLASQVEGLQVLGGY